MKRENQFVVAFRKLLKNKLATLCFVLVILELLMVIFAPLFTKFDPLTMDPLIRLRPGIWDTTGRYLPGHWLGTDELGRDVWSRILYGGRISLAVGFISTAMGITAGTFFGMLAGYYKKLDNIIMRIMDVFFTFPGILLAMLVVAMLGVSTVNSTIAISIWAVPGFARMVRSKVLSIKEEDYILAIKSLGASDARIIFKHILKNCIPVIIVTATMRIAGSIMSISTLSYLGIGAPPPSPEWGGLISDGKTYMFNHPHTILVPGITVMLTVIAYNILGDKLRDIVDPSLKD
jgi:peptide/nickel transport system permease protein